MKPNKNYTRTDSISITNKDSLSVKNLTDSTQVTEKKDSINMETTTK